jgi:hypothetical protein
MHPLLKADILLVIATIIGTVFLVLSNTISPVYGTTIVLIYFLAKIIGYLILPYRQFAPFLSHLIETSKLPILSGFEIFKTALVTLLFLGFLFIDPAIWLIESLLVVIMRIWGKAYMTNLLSAR